MHSRTRLVSILLRDRCHAIEDVFLHFLCGPADVGQGVILLKCIQIVVAAFMAHLPLCDHQQICGLRVGEIQVSDRDGERETG